MLPGFCDSQQAWLQEEPRVAVIQCCQFIDTYAKTKNLQAGGFAFDLWPVRLRWAAQKAGCLVLAQVPLVLVLQPVLGVEAEVGNPRIG